MKKLSKETCQKIYNNLQKNRKKIKFRSIFLALFVLGVNAYAWFIFISTANVNVSSHVVSWDVSFTDQNVAINDLEIVTNDIYPGMPTYTKTVQVHNNSEVNTVFTYEINNILLLGNNVTPASNVEAYLNSTYPFITTFSYSDNVLAPDDTITFTITINWPFAASDTGARSHYQLNSQYTYDPSVIYYTNSNDTYTAAEVDAITFPTLRNNLYLAKDDADSFWGSNCKVYQDNQNDYCYKFHILLKVEQTNAPIS